MKEEKIKTMVKDQIALEDYLEDMDFLERFRKAIEVMDVIIMGGLARQMNIPIYITETAKERLSNLLFEHRFFISLVR